jgi:hypothetical protein
MKRSEAFPTKYLSKDDVHAPTVGIIERIVNETLGTGDDQEIKPILYFSSGLPKPMVINTTNWTNVEAIYGDESDNWIGKSIEVWVDPSVVYGGKRIGGLRLRAPAGQPPPPGATIAHPPLAYKDALAMYCSKTGYGEPEFKSALKGYAAGHGYQGYSPSRDTEFVHSLIDNQEVAL